MIKINFLAVSALMLLVSSFLYAQPTYHAVDVKSAQLMDTKYLKTGEIVLLENIGVCNDTRIQIYTPHGDVETVLWTSQAIFYEFNELPDNNWSLTIISENLIDVISPPTIYNLTFIDGEVQLTEAEDETIEIPLSEISLSTVINDDVLVLVGNSKAYFTNFDFSNIITKSLDQDLQLLKCPVPAEAYMYYQYEGEDRIWATENQFNSENLIAFNLGSQFRDIHYLGNYAIFQDQTEISYVFGIFGFDWIEQGKIIYDFRQHGQNLTYYTLDSETELTFNKLYLDADGELQHDQYSLEITDQNSIPGLHWDGDFLGVSYAYQPLPSEEFEDDFPGLNYYLNYNFESKDLTTNPTDIAITNIQYSISKIDTVPLFDDKEKYFTDLDLEIELTNNSDESIEDIRLYTSTFEGVNCAHNYLRDLDSNISLNSGESISVMARYTGLESNNINYLEHPTCIYALGSMHKVDTNFDDNIYCFTPSELTATKDKNYREGLKIFPNPAQNFIQVLEDDGTFNRYEIYDIQGQLVKTVQLQNTSDVIDVSPFKKGAYFLVNTGNMRRKLFTIY